LPGIQPLTNFPNRHTSTSRVLVRTPKISSRRPQSPTKCGTQTTKLDTEFLRDLRGGRESSDLRYFLWQPLGSGRLCRDRSSNTPRLRIRGIPPHRANL